MREVVDAYTETYISRNSCIPIVHLLSNGPKGACPLLSADGRCSVHDCKPTVCALFPLGRVAINRTDDQAPGEGEMPTIKYILNDHSCGSAKTVNTVRSWLAKFGIPEQDEFYLLWNKVRMSLTPAVMKLEEGPEKGAAGGCEKAADPQSGTNVANLRLERPGRSLAAPGREAAG